MTLLIFSCNRAMQLQALLSSLQAHLTVDGPLSIHVVYAASNDAYQAGYEIVSKAYPTVQFHQERQQRKWTWPYPFRYWKNVYRYLKQPTLWRTSDFKVLTEQVIADAPSEGVMFLTDDSLFTQAIHLDADRLSTVIDDPTSAHSYSLRHGLSLKPLPTNSQPFNRDGYVWRFAYNRSESGHWAWRFSVDGHLYTRRALLPILHRLNYANPNSLEGFVNEYIKNVRPDLFNTLLFDDRPSLVGFILNKVQTYNGNLSLDIAPDFLNTKLLVGYQLCYNYKQPVTDFQPELEAIELIQPATGQREILTIT